MNRNDFFKMKIKALLHDPPEKALILGRISHEDRAKELIRTLVKDDTMPEEIKLADQIASAADRVDFPRDVSISFRANALLKHPLSGEELRFGSLRSLDLGLVQQSVDVTVQQLLRVGQDDAERTFLSLWRMSQELLQGKSFDLAKLGQLWCWLPADTRIPDHPIWDHQKITSAIASSLPEPSFLLFSLGPVQQFISTSRKTQDLWASSYIMSYMLWRGMKVVVEEYGPDCVIYPELYQQPLMDLWLIQKGVGINKPKASELSVPTLPNVCLLLLPENGAIESATRIKSEIQKAFREMCEKVKAGLEFKLSMRADEWSSLWERQVENFLDIYFVCYKWPFQYENFLIEYVEMLNLESDWQTSELIKAYKKSGQFAPNIGTIYGSIYDMTVRLLRSRKAVRTFNQVKEDGFKCTLCGVREPLHPQNEDARGFWNKVSKIFTEISPNERLCAICTTKRFAEKFFFSQQLGFTVVFPSTSSIGTSGFKLHVIQKMALDRDLAEAVKAYNSSVINLLGMLGGSLVGTAPKVKEACGTISDREIRLIAEEFAGIDGEWLFEESFLPERLLRDFPKPISDKDINDAAERAKESLAKFLKRSKEVGLGKPSAYYAILQMDGDNMGKWLSGEMAPKTSKILHPEIVNECRKQWGEDVVELKRPLSPSLHASISRALRDFSLTAARYIVEERHSGKLIYAGGDDVLAFVTLEDLFETLRELRAYFSGSLNIKGGQVGVDFSEKIGFACIHDKYFMMMGGATASIGVAVSHHLQPLSQALEESRKMAESAKDLKGKDAFAISLIKRSGESLKSRAKWSYEDGKVDTVLLLSELVRAFRDGELSPRFIYNLRDEIIGLDKLPEDAKLAEVTRLLERHVREDIEPKRREKIRQSFATLLSCLSLEGVHSLLAISRFIAQEVS